MSKLSELPTYVYIDASNISQALKTFDIKIDFLSLYKYLKSKYPRLEEVRYFEGISSTDWRKGRYISELKSLGYSIHTVIRKSYIKNKKVKNYKCSNCGHINNVVTLKEKTVLKSNIDVFLCTQFMKDLLSKRVEVHAILLSCDGDFADMIREILFCKENVSISVLSTPYQRENNYLSRRLKDLSEFDRYRLVDILTIEDYIKNGGNTEVGPPSDA